MMKLFQPYVPVFYDSGTSALAAAIIAAANAAKVDRPEVILPAYGCPDLVSAVVHAGVKPVLVDLDRDRPWMDLAGVKAAVNANTVAIIAVHLFGILERVKELKSVAAGVGAVVIEDSAQAFPGAGEDRFWSADLVVLSFGRGKPVSVLGGGAVLSRSETVSSLLPAPVGDVRRGALARMRSLARIGAYNALIEPRLYWILDGLPFLHLGETRYQPLPAIGGLAAHDIALVAANVSRYRRAASDVQQSVAALLRDHAGPGIIDLPLVCETGPNRRLLRYPLLLPAGQRGTWLQQLNKMGLGASPMYPAILPEIPGLESVLGREGAFPSAASFAERIVTLPLHDRVRMADVSRMREALSALTQV